MMFERRHHPELKKLINNDDVEGVEASETEDTESVEYTNNAPPLPLTLKQVLKIPDLYLLSFIFCFASTSISIFTINYKVSII